MTPRAKIIAIGIGAVALIAVTTAAYFLAITPHRAQEEADVHALVTDFGGYLKSILLYGDEETVKREIQQNYGRFVTNDLLQLWRKNPKSAPGRLSPSPWPDRIEVASVTSQGAGYTVSGILVMMTSDALADAGDAGKIPVFAQVIRENGEWKIAVFQEAGPSPIRTTNTIKATTTR